MHYAVLLGDGLMATTMLTDGQQDWIRLNIVPVVPKAHFLI
jgi:hypothetical protein